MFRLFQPQSAHIPQAAASQTKTPNHHIIPDSNHQGANLSLSSSHLSLASYTATSSSTHTARHAVNRSQHADGSTFSTPPSSTLLDNVPCTAYQAISLFGMLRYTYDFHIIHFRPYQCNHLLHHSNLYPKCLSLFSKPLSLVVCSQTLHN